MFVPSKLQMDRPLHKAVDISNKKYLILIIYVVFLPKKALVITCATMPELLSRDKVFLLSDIGIFGFIKL